MIVTVVIKNKKAYQKLLESIDLLKDLKESYPWDQNIQELIDKFEHLAKNLICIQ